MIVAPYPGYEELLAAAARLGRPIHDLSRVIAYDWTPAPDWRCGHRSCLCAIAHTRPEPEPPKGAA